MYTSGILHIENVCETNFTKDQIFINLTHVENFLLQNCNIFSVLSIFK